MPAPAARPVPTVLMVLLLFVTQACTDIFLPGLPQIASEFNSSVEVASRTISVYNICQAVAVLFIGVVSDVRGRRPTILLCFGLHILATVGIALCSSIGAMIVLRAVQALGSAAVYIVLRMIIKDTLDEQAQVHATGLLVIGLVLSPILAPVLGSAIVQWSNWRVCFWVLCLLDIPLFAWALARIGETNLRQPALKAAFSWSAHARHYGQVLGEPYFRGMALLVGAAFAAFYAFISISSFMFLQQLALSASTYGYVFIALALSYLAGNRLMSRLNARALPPRRIIGVGLWVSVAGAACVLAALLFKQAASVAVLMVIGTCLLRLATALIIPPAQVAVTNHFPQHGAHALGLLTCTQYGFAALGTLVVSTLWFAPSVNYMISTLAFVALSALAYLALGRRAGAAHTHKR
jgi:DHA1 family bicyclomycin/chloramphenicol resistance-like MFS transporter